MHPLLLLMNKGAQSGHTGYYFTRGKKREVCHLKREKGHKVFNAGRGKGPMGWFYGLQLHWAIKHPG